MTFFHWSLKIFSIFFWQYHNKDDVDYADDDDDDDNCDGGGDGDGDGGGKVDDKVMLIHH